MAASSRYSRRSNSRRGAPARLGAFCAAAFGLVLAPEAARAHPHVFIDGGVDFRFDDAGRLAALRVTWIYDPLTSLFMLEDLGIAAAGSDPLAPEERRALAAYQTEWIEGFEGDSYLLRGKAQVVLSGPLHADAELSEGRVAIRFERAVETPFRPGADTVVEVYDPTYFTGYSVTETPRLEGAAAGCAARIEPYTPTAPLRALQQSLLALGVDEDPDEPVGALFADRVHLACD